MNHVEKSAPSLLLIILLVGFPQISETIYTPALPTIAHGLLTTNSLVQWTLSIYFLGFALGVFYWGRLSDHIGRRPVMLIGIITYGISTLSCLAAPTISWLLVSRLFQAFGASVGSIITQTIMREAFHDNDRQKLFSTIGIALSFAPALGPVLGGYINQWFGWRANFAFLFIMSLGLIIYCFIALPETRVPHPQQLRPSKISHVALILIKDKRIWGCTWAVAAFNGMLFSYYAEAPFIFIKQLGLTSGQYGWLGLTIAGSTLAGSLLSHRLIQKYTSDQFIFRGCLIALISTSAFSIIAICGWIGPAHQIRSIILILVPFAFTMLGCVGFILPPVLSSALTNYKEVLGTAGALFGFSYYVLIAGFTWMMGILHTGGFLPMPLYFWILSLSLLFAYYFLIKN